MMKVQEVIDRILCSMPDVRLERTADTIKTGSGTDEPRGIVTAFTASMNVLRLAVEKNANLIITHEPTFYNHWDDVQDLREDPVYLAKRDYIERHGLTIWRCHDHMHLHKPDLIHAGMLKQLGWEPLQDASEEKIVHLGGMSLQEMVGHLKRSLSVPALRIAGRSEGECFRAGMLLGAIGAEAQMDFIRRHEDVDVILCGETVEWQACEYVRDAHLLGRKLTLVILGHYHSEDAAMRHFADELRSRIPGVPVWHAPSGDAVSFVFPNE